MKARQTFGFMESYFFWKWQYHRRNEFVIAIGDGDDSFAKSINEKESCFRTPLEIIKGYLNNNLDIYSPPFIQDEIFLTEIRHNKTTGDHINVDIKPGNNTEKTIMELNCFIRFKQNNSIGIIEDFLIEELKATGLIKKSNSLTSFWPRAVGLWIWDREQEVGVSHGSKSSIFKEFESFPFFYQLELGSEPDYSFWLKRTDECIQSLSVLTFDKKQKVKRKKST